MMNFKPPRITSHRDWTLDECHAHVMAALPDQPNTVLLANDPRAMTEALFLIAGPLNRKVR